MLRTNVKRMLARSFAAVTLCLTAATLTASPTPRAGGESFQIYLNNKLLLTQVASRSFSLQSLELKKSNDHDELVIYYYHCNTPDRAGRGRSISLKDTDGRVIKTWNFGDPAKSGVAMKISVKELLQLEKDHPGSPLNLVYMSQGRTQGQPLASL